MVEQSVSVGKLIKSEAWHPELLAGIKPYRVSCSFGQDERTVWRRRMLSIFVGIPSISSKFLEKFSWIKPERHANDDEDAWTLIPTS